MQKAYPTMTYNDLQCQIGGCRKEYKCQSARRNHVLRIHFQNELSCPIKLCSFRSNDFPRINSHLKEDHDLKNGYLSIESAAVRDQFNADRAKHNHRLTTLVQLAFPCHIPDVCKTTYKATDVSASGETVQSLITRIREKDRKFQVLDVTAPPNPLRLRSPSTSSDSDSSESEKMCKTSTRESPSTTEAVSKLKGKTSTPLKVKSAEPKSSPEALISVSSASTSSSSESDDENVAAKETQLTSSASTSSGSFNGCEKDGTDKHDKNSDTSKSMENPKENEEPGSD
ncbi:unnamed protein product, partial [Strongylus vulgaris]